MIDNGKKRYLLTVTGNTLGSENIIIFLKEKGSTIPLLL
jgi:hypothetical protein